MKAWRNTDKPSKVAYASKNQWKQSCTFPSVTKMPVLAPNKVYEN